MVDVAGLLGCDDVAVRLTRDWINLDDVVIQVAGSDSLVHFTSLGFDACGWIGSKLVGLDQCE